MNPEPVAPRTHWLLNSLGIATGAAFACWSYLNVVARGAPWPPGPLTLATLTILCALIGWCLPERHRSFVIACAMVPCHALAFLAVMHYLDGFGRRDALAFAILGATYALCALTAGTLGASLSRFLRRRHRTTRP
ncbi:MAG: hypothetical protein H6834_16280 [Planctomycetes bacterium]|nr:hypothetical protein [Planctomycetota bacterium]